MSEGWSIREVQVLRAGVFWGVNGQNRCYRGWAREEIEQVILFVRRTTRIAKIRLVMPNVIAVGLFPASIVVYGLVTSYIIHRSARGSWY